MAIATINPATGETIREFAGHDRTEVERRLALAAATYRRDRSSSFAIRANRMRRAAEILEERKRELSTLMTLEMGKPIRGSLAEIEKCAATCRYYADNAERFLVNERIIVPRGEAWIEYQPLGVILAVMPWNFPFWQVIRFAAPALMAGNAALLKHASNVPQCALAIEQIFLDAEFPAGAFQTLLVGAGEVENIIADFRVAAVTLTGSEGAGRSVAATAGKHIKKSVLELGGSDPFVVMPSADLVSAVKTALTARLINNGQSCIAAKRFIIHDQVYDRFLGEFVAAIRAVRVGDPMDEATELGPLATTAIRDELHGQVERSVAAGARLVTGGRMIDRPGFYYEPTVLADVPQNSPADIEELFGPVAAVFRARDAAHAITIANRTSFGLGSSVWTRDESERDLFVREIESGQVFVNEMVASDPRLPFGGVKNSGYGRELSYHGIREFVNTKTVKIAAVEAGVEKAPAE